MIGVEIETTPSFSNSIFCRQYELSGSAKIRLEATLAPNILVFVRKLHSTLVLKVESVCSSELLVPTYKATWNYYTEH